MRAQKTILLASLKEPVGLALLMPGPPDLTSEIGNETPAPNSTTIQLQPQITVNFSTPVNPADVSLMVDDVDITTLAQVTEQKVTFTPPLALAGGDHTVNLSVGSDATTWKFTVNAPQVAGSTPAAQPGSGPALQPGTDAEAPPAPAAGTMPTPATIAAAQQGQAPGQAGGQTLAGATNQSAVTPPPKAAAAATSAETKKGPRPSLDGQIGVNTQWVSGSNPPDTNTLSAAEHVTYEKNGWHLEANGSGTLNSTLNPPPMRTSHAQFSDYVLQAGKKQGGWGMTFRFGTVSPSLYTDAQFVTAATPRQGAELMLKTPGGRWADL